MHEVSHLRTHTLHIMIEQGVYPALSFALSQLLRLKHLGVPKHELEKFDVFRDSYTRKIWHEVLKAY